MELELKFKSEQDFSSLLPELGFEQTKRKHQKDTYYMVDKEIDGIRCWLRVREDKLQNKASWDFHQMRSLYATEETEIAIAAEDAEKLKKIIAATTELSIACVVEKERQTYIREDIEIALDKIAGLGNFIEIEIEGEENSANIDRLNETVLKLGLDPKNAIAVSYPDLLMEQGL